MSKFKVSLSPSRGVEVTFDLAASDGSLRRADDVTREACSVLKSIVDAWGAWSEQNGSEEDKAFSELMREQRAMQLAEWKKQKAAMAKAGRMMDEL